MDEQPGMDLRPPTERVPARRGAPLLVALAVLGALALFVARPWATDVPRPTLVALSSAPPPAPTVALETAPPSATVSLVGAPGEPTVRCGYGRAHNGTRRLVSVEVPPPRVMLAENASASDIGQVGWRFQVETNVQQGVFSRAWQAAALSRMQASGTVDGRAPSFTSLNMAIREDEVTETSVFRVRLVVEWTTRNLEPAGRTEIVATTYQDARWSKEGDPFRPYCTGVLRIN